MNKIKKEMKKVYLWFIYWKEGKRKLELQKVKKEIQQIFPDKKKFIIINKRKFKIEEGKEKAYILIQSFYYYNAIKQELIRSGFQEGKDFISVIDYSYKNKKRINAEKYQWKKQEFFAETWEKRIEIMAGLIDKDCKSVLDMGCGECKLKKYLHNKVEYYGCDYKKREEGTIICDFNQYQYPRGVKADTIFISGALEYIQDYPWFIKKVCESRSDIILSYCIVENSYDLSHRVKLGWKNHLSVYDILMLMKENKYILVETANYNGNIIFKFVDRDIRGQK